MKRFLNLFVLVTFCFSNLNSYANVVAPALPQPGTMLMPSGEASLPVLKGLKLDPQDPLHMQFIIDPGNNKTLDQAQANQLIRYFLAALATPQQDIWVNLSPYEKERIMEDNLSYTDLGKAMLEQDYLLKQLASSLTYPETELGKAYWKAVNSELPPTPSLTKRGSEPTQSFNKVWISSREAEVYEGTNVVVITKTSLKALTDTDYLAMSASGDGSHFSQTGTEKRTVPVSGADAFKKTILPQIEQELNTGKNFANLRQIYNAVILASWFKNKFKESFFKYYLDKKNINGIVLDDKTSKEKIFNLYVQAFQKGAYNYIKKEAVGANGYSPARKITRRAYFSGGISPDIANKPTVAQSAAVVPATGGLPIVEVWPNEHNIFSRDMGPDPSPALQITKALVGSRGYRYKYESVGSGSIRRMVSSAQENEAADRAAQALGLFGKSQDLPFTSKDLTALIIDLEMAVSDHARWHIINFLTSVLHRNPQLSLTIEQAVGFEQAVNAFTFVDKDGDDALLIVDDKGNTELYDNERDQRDPIIHRPITQIPYYQSLIEAVEQVTIHSEPFVGDVMAGMDTGYFKIVRLGVSAVRARQKGAVREAVPATAGLPGADVHLGQTGQGNSGSILSESALELAYVMHNLRNYLRRSSELLRTSDANLRAAALRIIEANKTPGKTTVYLGGLISGLDAEVELALFRGGVPVYAASKGVPQSPALLEKVSFGQRSQRANYSLIELPGLKASFAHDPWATAGAIAAAFKTGVKSVWFSRGRGVETSYRSKAGANLTIVAIQFDNHVGVNIRFYEDKMFIDFPIGQRQYADRLYAIVKALADVKPDTTTKTNIIASLSPIEQEVTQNAEKLRNILRNNYDGFITALNDVAPGADVALLLDSSLGIAKEDEFSTRGKQYGLEVILKIPGGSQAYLRFTRTFDGQKIVDMDWLGNPAGKKIIARALHHALSVLDEQGKPKDPAMVGTRAALRKGYVTQALRRVEEYGFHHDTSRKTLDESLRVAIESLERNKGVTNVNNVQDYDYRGLRILLGLVKIIDDYSRAFDGWDGFETEFRKVLRDLPRFRYNGPENQALSSVNDTIGLLVRWANSGLASNALWNAIHAYRPIEANERVYLTSQCDQWHLPRALAELAYDDTREYLLEAGIIAEPDQMVELAARAIKAVGLKTQNPDTFGLKIAGLNHDRSWQELLVEELSARAQQIQAAPALPEALALYQRQDAHDVNAAIRKLNPKAEIPLVERIRAGENLGKVYANPPMFALNDSDVDDLAPTTQALEQLSRVPYFASAEDNHLVAELEGWIKLLSAGTSDFKAQIAQERKPMIEEFRSLGLSNRDAMQMADKFKRSSKAFTQSDDRAVGLMQRAIVKIKEAQAQWKQIDHELCDELMYPGLGRLNADEHATLIWWIMVNRETKKGSAAHLQLVTAYPKVLLDKDIPVLAAYTTEELLMAGISGGRAAVTGNNGSSATGETPASTQGQTPTGGVAWQSVDVAAKGNGKFYFTRIPTTTEIKKVFDNVSFTVVALKENQSLREFAGLTK